MSSHLWVVWQVIGSALEALLAIAILKRVLWRSWPSLLALSTGDLLASSIMLTHNRGSSTYFFTYYGALAVSSLFRLWMLDNILASFPGAAFAKKDLRWMTATAGTIMTAVSWYASRTPHALRSELAHTAIYLDRCVTYACMAFYLAAIISILFIGLGWSHRGMLVASGLGVRMLSGVVVVTLISSNHPNIQMAGYVLRSLMAVVVLAIWLRAMLLPEEVLPELPESHKASLQRFIARLAQ